MDALDRHSKMLPSAMELRVMLPLIEHRFNSSKRNRPGSLLKSRRPLGRMRRAFGGCQDDYEVGLLRDHARYNCNTPTLCDTNESEGLYWPGLRTSPWVDSLSWTKTMSGSTYADPLVKELRKIVDAVGSSNAAASKKETTTAATPPFNGRLRRRLCCCLGGAWSRDEDDDDMSSVSRHGKRAELRAYNEGPEHRRLVKGPSNRWKTLFFVDNGRENKEVCELCPEFTKFIRSIPRRCSDAFVSAIAPGARINLHRGPTNTKLTCHFGLIVPPGDCKLKVGTESRGWTVGQWIFFNDSYVRRRRRPRYLFVCFRSLPICTCSLSILSTIPFLSLSLRVVTLVSPMKGGITRPAHDTYSSWTFGPPHSPTRRFEHLRCCETSVLSFSSGP